MIIQEIPYEWIERFLGQYVADHFNSICLILAALGLLIAICYRRKRSGRQQPTVAPKENVFESRQGEWTATGWYREDESDLWQPPDYIKQESRDKWQWDEEKRIWIDLEKKARLERYRAYRESEGKGLTYEEWKAAKMKEAEHPEE